LILEKEDQLRKIVTQIVFMSLYKYRSLSKNKMKLIKQCLENRLVVIQLLIDQHFFHLFLSKIPAESKFHLRYLKKEIFIFILKTNKLIVDLISKSFFYSC
jgi:hypothetical protein